jgi:hypothetical protein
MWMILSSGNDTSARWAFQSLKTLGVAPLEWVETESLLDTRMWEHRIGADGVSTNIVLPNGRAVAHSEVKGVLNRMTGPPPNQAQLAVAADREYAQTELTAFYLSWLYAMPCRVVNRPTPQGLCGRWAHQSEWVTMAAEAGLPVVPYRQTAEDPPLAGYGSLAPAHGQGVSAVVLGERVFGYQLPQAFESGCARLAKIAKLDLMGVNFVQHGGGLAFASATPMPYLETGGMACMQHLAELFGAGGAA